MKKIYIETLGCSKNVVDSEQMLGLLDDSFALSETLEAAEIVIVNTCSFINDAKEESIDTILEISELKHTGNLEKLLVTGCLSQRYPETLLEEIPEVDAVVGTGSFFKIVEVIEALLSGSTQKVFMESVDLVVPEDIPRILTTPKNYAYLKIAEGCDNRCTYCIIPKLRGKYRSRDMAEIVKEAEDLVKMGITELIVIAQDTSRYGVDLYGAPQLDVLLTKLSAVEGIKWIRVHYAYPDILDERLIDGFFKNEKVVNYFDIPVQHASNAVLKRMNRRTSQEDIRRVVDLIRSKDADACIRTTVIVGFPGETEEDFNELLRFVKDIRFDRLGAFGYSDEEDTPAEKLDGKLDEEVIAERRNALMAAQMEISEALSLSKIGKTYEVIVEEIADNSKEEGFIYVGRTAYDAPEIDGVVYVHTTEELPLNDYVKVRVTDALEYDLIGVVVDENEHS